MGWRRETLGRARRAAGRRPRARSRPARAGWRCATSPTPPQPRARRPEDALRRRLARDRREGALERRHAGRARTGTTWRSSSTGGTWRGSRRAASSAPRSWRSSWRSSTSSPRIDGRPPLLLLDDVFSELDPHRRAHLVRRIGGLPQAFVTTTTLGRPRPGAGRGVHRVGGHGPGTPGAGRRAGCRLDPADRRSRCAGCRRPAAGRAPAQLGLDAQLRRARRRWPLGAPRRGAGAAGGGRQSRLLEIRPPQLVVSADDAIDRPGAAAPAEQLLRRVRDRARGVASARAAGRRPAARPRLDGATSARPFDRHGRGCRLAAAWVPASSSSTAWSPKRTGSPPPLTRCWSRSRRPAPRPAPRATCTSWSAPAEVGGRAREATALVADTIRREYYYDESAGVPICLEKAVRSANRKLRGSREGNGLPPRLARHRARGRAQQRAVRGHDRRRRGLPGPRRAAADARPQRSSGACPRTTRCGVDVWRGELAVGDSLLLVSRNLTEVVGTEELKNAVVTLHPQSAVEHLHHLFVAAGGDGSDAVLAVEATELALRPRRSAPGPGRRAGRRVRRAARGARSRPAPGGGRRLGGHRRVRWRRVGGDRRVRRRRRPGAGPDAAARAVAARRDAAGLATRVAAPGGARAARRSWAWCSCWACSSWSSRGARTPRHRNLPAGEQALVDARPRRRGGAAGRWVATRPRRGRALPAGLGRDPRAPRPAGVACRRSRTRSRPRSARVSTGSTARSTSKADTLAHVRRAPSPSP